MIKAEEKRVRLLDCKHPMASINASHRDTEDPEDLLYTAASLAAEKLFGIAINEKENRSQSWWDGPWPSTSMG